MELTDIDISEAAVLCDLFNEQTAHLPLCCRAESGDFAGSIGLSREVTDSHRCTQTSNERLIAVRAGDAFHGFADIAVAQIDMKGDGKLTTEGLINFLTYSAGLGHAGEALLAECEAHLTSHGASRIWAFHKFSVWRQYHSGLAGISDRMAHVLALFWKNGYLSDPGEIGDVIFAQDYSGISCPPEPDQFKVIVDKRSHRYHEVELVVRILADDREVGICEASPLIVGTPESQRNSRFVIGWIHVEPELRRNALGRYLLNRTAWEMGQLGYPSGLAQCNLASPLAMSFYSNCGFTIADVAYHELTKELPNQ